MSNKKCFALADKPNWSKFTQKTGLSTCPLSGYAWAALELHNDWGKGAERAKLVDIYFILSGMASRVKCT